MRDWGCCDHNIWSVFLPLTYHNVQTHFTFTDDFYWGHLLTHRNFIVNLYHSNISVLDDDLRKISFNSRSVALFYGVRSIFINNENISHRMCYQVKQQIAPSFPTQCLPLDNVEPDVPACRFYYSIAWLCMTDFTNSCNNANPHFIFLIMNLSSQECTTSQSTTGK